MRRAALALACSAFVFGATLGPAAAAPAAEKKAPPLRDVTGLEWLEMSVAGRMDQILASMMRLAQDGVPLQLPPDDYYRAVHEAVRRDPSLNEVMVTQIVARHAYDKEPEARGPLDTLRGRRLAGK